MFDAARVECYGKIMNANNKSSTSRINAKSIVILAFNITGVEIHMTQADEHYTHWARGLPPNV